MQVRQAALGGFLAAVLVFGAGVGPVAQAGSQASAVGAMAQISRPTEAVFDGLHHWRDAALDVAFDAFGAVMAQVRQL
jgi:hypothetical protein